VPKNALDNPLVLPILGLLVERPRHAYAVYLEVRNATVYTLLGTLTEAGWIEPTGTADLRTTRAGGAALADRVAAQLRDADLAGGPAFMTALAYLGILPRDLAVTVLRERVGRLRAERQRLAHAVRGADVAEIHMIEAHYLVARLRHDADWLARLAGRVESGTVTWPHTG
jgi:hypothetical protein